MCTRVGFLGDQTEDDNGGGGPPTSCRGEWRANKGLCISLLTKVTVDIEEEEPRRKQTKRPRGSVEGRRTDSERIAQRAQKV